MKWNPTVIAACIGAIAVVVTAILTHALGEKQYRLERAKLMTDVIVRTATMNTDQFRGVLNRICLSPVLKEETDALYRAAFKMPCPTSL
jgi:hypothetical protein